MENEINFAPENSNAEFEDSLSRIMPHFVKDEGKRALIEEEILLFAQEQKENLEKLKDKKFSKKVVEDIFEKVRQKNNILKTEEDVDSILAISEALATWSRMSFV